LHALFKKLVLFALLRWLDIGQQRNDAFSRRSLVLILLLTSVNTEQTKEQRDSRNITRS